MKLDALLRAHAFMRVERPPEIWEADTEDTRFVPLLGEMIAASFGSDLDLGALTLNASNVVVEWNNEEAEDIGAATAPAGEYVAITVSGPGNHLGGDATWAPGRGAPASALLTQLNERLLTAGVCYAYVRRLPTSASVTVFLKRIGPPG